MRDTLIEEMKKVFGQSAGHLAVDQKRIEHALSVLGYAEQIQQSEGGDSLVVQAAAILHDIGIHEAERKYNSAAGKYQEIEGPPIAEEILKRHNVAPDVIEHISRIIANHHSAKDIDTIEFRVLWDADWLVNIPDEFGDANKEKLQKIIDKTFKTDTGRQMAIEQFVKN